MEEGLSFGMADGPRESHGAQSQTLEATLPK